MKIMKFASLVLLFGMLSVVGCGPQGDSKPSGAKDAGVGAKGDESKPHAHGQGPNGGVVFDLGKYHGEFTVDHGKKECMVVAIGADEKTPTPIAAKEITVTTKETKTKEGTVVDPMTITLTPKDEANGKATKFVGTDPGLGNVADFEGTVITDIDGKPAQGSFKE